MEKKMLKNDLGDFFVRFYQDCWVQTQNLENEFRYVKFGTDEKKRRTDLEKVEQFTVQFSSVQFCHASNIYKVFDGTP